MRAASGCDRGLVIRRLRGASFQIAAPTEQQIKSEADHQHAGDDLKPRGDQRRQM